MSDDALPTIELLEAQHDFPSSYTFKVIGKTDDGFVARVVAAVREELSMGSDPPFSLRQTPAGRHVAITLRPLVGSAYDVLAVYRRVRTVPGLVMLC